jgi:lysophospholipase L1-like esterase
MYRFQVMASTQPGETIVLVGASPALGLWDVSQGIPLQTSAERYPLWWVDLDLADQPLEQGQSTDPSIQYKYVRLQADGTIEWETWETNRWVPLEPAALPSPIVVDDGWFGMIPTHPYGYFADPLSPTWAKPSPEGLKVVVIGSSVALGCSAWLLRGWAWHLEQSLKQLGHQLVNVSALGANVGTTIARFTTAVAPEQPDIVIIALSLGNEGFVAAIAPPQQRAIQRRFENGLQQLIKMTRDLGAQPILAGLYPNAGYTIAHQVLMQATAQRMSHWGVPVLDWFDLLNDGQGRWQAGLSFDPAHPNTVGHRLMYEAIDLSLFERNPHQSKPTEFASTTGFSDAEIPVKNLAENPIEVPIHQDATGFRILHQNNSNGLRLINPTLEPYSLPGEKVKVTGLPAGLYIAEDAAIGNLFSLFIQDHDLIETPVTVPPQADLIFYPAFHFFDSSCSQVLFYDNHLAILKVSDQQLYLINDSEHEYNIQPMWKAVCSALKVMPAGVYADPADADAPFRTLMIGDHGVESRVKVPGKSAIALTYQCKLSEVNRVAILSLGDRCAARMLLYKLQYDGPAFPFDLTRTTNLADVADIVQTGFEDMWNPHYLSYCDQAKRIYHTKWTGLSFAHEVEDSDDPVDDMSPVHERMRLRYSARAERFWYTLQNCDQVLFVRTGGCQRGSVLDLLDKLTSNCGSKPFLLIIISPQASEEFAGLPNVKHYNLEFNPDRMYEDLGHWLYCTEIMRDILNSVGVSSKNLFWCPPTPPQWAKDEPRSSSGQSKLLINAELHNPELHKVC